MLHVAQEHFALMFCFSIISRLDISGRASTTSTGGHMCRSPLKIIQNPLKNKTKKQNKTTTTKNSGTSELPCLAFGTVLVLSLTVPL